MKVLVTGATGFFGSTFVDTLLRQSEQQDADIVRVAAFARSESRLAKLADKYDDRQAFRPFLGDIRDYDRLVDACRSCDLVVHAAALKRVDDGSYNPSEMVATNIIGTQNVIRAATDVGVKRVIIISSDKAVAPINVYGATKFVAEQFAISYNSISAPRGTVVSIARYGNVLASTGSVLHIWKKQKQMGVPLTVTDRLMTRFVMTAGDACELVLRLHKCMEGGEIIVPVLKSVHLTSMAAAVGGPSSEISFTGKRVGGEKLDEILLNEDEQGRVVKHGPDLIIPAAAHPWVAHQSWDDCKPCVMGTFPYSSGASYYLSHTPETIQREIARAMAEHAELL